MKLVVGISGASGAIYGLRILEVLQQVGVETHLVMSDSAKRTIVYETDYTIDAVKKLATHVHDVNDVGACISSGSFRHHGMVIAPCSIKTLSALANSFNTNLLIRAAAQRHRIAVLEAPPLARALYACKTASSRLMVMRVLPIENAGSTSSSGCNFAA